jgi:hypothetical protein
MSKNNYEGIHPYVVNQVRYHARSLMRHSAIHGVEVEDLEQELMLDYLSRKQAYDPEKAKWSTFVVGVLVEVPVMLSLVAFANRTRGYFK